MAGQRSPRGRRRVRSDGRRSARRGRPGRTAAACRWPAGHHPAGDDARGDEVDDGLRDDVGVDREVAAVDEVGEHLVRDAADADLERGAVVDEAGDVRGDLVGLGVRGFVDDSASGRSTATSASIRSSGMTLFPRVRGIAGLTSAITRRAANTAACVTSTETPRLHMPSSSGGATCTSATSTGMRPLFIRAGTSASETGRYSIGARRLAQPAEVAADVEDAMPIARSLGRRRDP